MPYRRWVRFHDLRQFAATSSASTKEIMSRGGWKSVAMVVRYEHASDERDALLAQALNPFTSSGNVVPIARGDDGDRALARATRVSWKVRCWSYPR